MQQDFTATFSYLHNSKREIIFSNIIFLKNEYHDFTNHTKTDITNCLNIYIDKKIKINRSKLRDTKYKIVREPAKADIILFNIDDYTTNNTMYKFSMGDYINLDHFIKLNPNLVVSSENSKILESLIKEGKGLYVNSWYNSCIVLPYSAKAEQVDNTHTILLEKVSYIKTMYFYHDKIVDVDLLYKNRTEEIILDKELYNNLNSLFISSDKENQVVALQALANCNYIKSAPYILKLIFDHSNEIHSLREKNHINFKSLLTFFNIERLYNSRSTIDNCIKKLNSKKLMSLENMQILIDLYTVDDFGINSNYLTISKLTFTSEAITSILEGESQLSSSTIDEDYLKSLSVNFDDGSISTN